MDIPRLSEKEAFILQFLINEGETHGLGIVKDVVPVEQSVAGRVGRPRKYYALEPAGARALRETYSTMQAMAGGLIPKLTELAES